MRVSAETIYKTLFIQSRGALNKDLKAHLRTKRLFRQALTKTLKGKGHTSIVDGVSIRERPAEVEDRALPGHWEGDLIICQKSRPVLVLYERKTKITFITRLMGKTAAETVSAIMAVFQRLSPDMRRSATFDNGGEFAQHALLQGLLSETTYFCDAYASWQKGGVENTNGRLRRWIPRSTDLDEMTEQEIQEIAMTLNTTPRKCLNFRSPIEAFLSELGTNVDIRFNRHVALRS